MTSSTSAVLFAALAAALLGGSGCDGGTQLSPPPVAPPPVPAAPIDVPASLALTPAGREAVQVLGRAPYFGGWGVGAAGAPTPVVVAWRKLLVEPHAADALALVLERGSDAGKLMALAGLYRVDHARFVRELPRFRGRAGTVRVMTSGCMPGGDPEPIARVVERADAVRLGRPDETLADWSAAHPGAPIELDLAGGGYTAVMLPRP